MMDRDVDLLGVGAASALDESSWAPESGGETWCDDELALDKAAGTMVEDETLVLEEAYEVAPPADPDLWLYRDRTIAVLRRYLRLAVEVGRLPALLGREFFRTRVTSYHTQIWKSCLTYPSDLLF